MLDAALTEQVRTHLERLTEPVELVAALDDSDRATEMRELLETTAALSERVTFRVDDGDTDVRRPSFAIRRRGGDVDGNRIEVRFVGVPLGHELTSYVLALLQVGGVAPKVDPELADAVRALDVDLSFETYYAMSCQVCPDVVQAFNTLSILNPRIRHTAIDGAQVPDEVEAREIRAVPAVFSGGEPFEQGRVTLEEIVARLDSSVAERATEAISAKDPFDVLVVGGGPAGSAAAIYAARKGLRVGVVAERFGGQLLETLSIENFLSVPHTEGPQLASAMEAHVGEHDVDVMTMQRATRLAPADRVGGLVTVELESGASLRARSVILSTGARWRQVNVPGEDEYRNRGVAYCPHCDGPLYKDKRVAVIGGGNSGVEAAIDLAGICSHVQVIEFDDKLRADAVLCEKLASLDNVEVALSTATTEIRGDGSTVTGLVADDRESGDERRYDVDGVFVQIGQLPNTAWLDGTVELTDRGEIVIDDRGATSVPGVFAAGDCTTVPYKQIMIAMGAGSVAALSAFDHLIRTSAVADDGAAEGSTTDSSTSSPAGDGNDVVREPAAVGAS